MSTVVQGILVYSLVFTIAAVGLSLIVGYAGIFSAGHAALFGVGGFTYAVMASRDISHDLLVVLPVAIVIGGLVSALAALPALRLRGDYFLVASVGFQIVALRLIVNWEAVSGGPPGLYALPLPEIGGFPLIAPEEMLPVAAVVAAAVIVLSWWVVRSPFGRSLRALAGDEMAVSASGGRVSLIKLAVFVYGGILAAIGGVLYVAYLQVASPGDFSLATSIAMLAMVLIGGAGSIWGPVLGAAILSSLPYWLSTTSLSDVSTNLSSLVFGAVLIVVTVFSPNGVAGIFRRRGKSGATEDPPSGGSGEPVGEGAAK